MDFFLVEKATSRQLDFPIIPDDISATTGANVITFNIIKSGESKMPRGEKVTGYSWTSMLPGSSMNQLSFVQNWQEPKAIVDQLETWKKNGTELTLIVGSYLNVDVFVDVFNYKYFGAGHCNYNITLTIFPHLTVTTSPAPAAKKSKTSSGGSTKKGKVTGSKVAYRSGPGKSYKKLGTLKKGTEVTIYGTSGNWYKIKENPEWWISSSYVKITSGAEEKKKKSSKRKSSKKNGAAKNPTNGKQPYTTTLPKTSIIQAAKKTVVKTGSGVTKGSNRMMTK